MRVDLRALRDACQYSTDIYNGGAPPRTAAARTHLVFRGSTGIEDFRRSFDVRTARWANDADVAVHRGYKRRFDALRPHVVRHVGRDRSVTFTGHSMGGAIAAMAATWCVENELVEPERVCCYVFGTPHIGNAAFVERVRGALGDNLVCVQADADIVPRLPVNSDFWSLGNALCVPERGSVLRWCPEPRRPEGLGALVGPLVKDGIVSAVLRGHSTAHYLSIFERLLQDAGDVADAA